MSYFVARLKKLEQRHSSDRKEIIELFDNQNLDILERIRILYDAGIITGEMIAGWIKQGSNIQMENKNEERFFYEKM